MQRKTFYMMCFLICCAVAVPLWAQEGHPLVGTWLGDWGATPSARQDVLVMLEWNGKVLSGVLNPGPDASPLQKLTLDAPKWAVHFEADAKDSSGKTVHYVVDGKLEDIGLPHRKLVGTWMAGTTKGDFELTRQ